MYITGENDSTVDEICNNLFDHKCDWYVLEEYVEERKLVYKTPPIYGVWLTETKRRQRKE